MKRILVPVDFSEQATNAAKVAAKIAKKTGSEIYLLHMFELPSDVIDPTNFTTGETGPLKVMFMKKIHEKFEQFKKSDFFEGINVVESVQFHKTFEGIIDASKEHEIDLVIMGSQGASGLEEFFIGSNTEKVVRNSDVPVLVIKDHNEDFEIKNIVFASDFTKENKKTFDKLLDFVSIFDSKIHLLKVNTPYNFETTRESNYTMDAFIKEYDLKNYSINIYNDNSIERGILNFTNEVDADVIALNTHGRSGLSHLFNGSITEDLTNHSIKPVITFKI
ncbi:universal stress protein [Aureivirga sp. CE67]|uniref:universal stress protein n=1 Tax=Aureivirga sp. CE67 TaxID=1788983 RepID=UPI0018CA7CBE|nr:universal stress protein [Aureivirga sp. CE67]